MNMKRKSFSIYIIPILVVVLCLLVWPCKLIGTSTYTSASLEKGLFNSHDSGANCNKVVIKRVLC